MSEQGYFTEDFRAQVRAHNEWAWINRESPLIVVASNNGEVSFINSEDLAAISRQAEEYLTEIQASTEKVTSVIRDNITPALNSFREAIQSHFVFIADSLGEALDEWEKDP